ncbi:glycosyltransferase family 2 protein [Nitrosophilus kaiyonis]|uniref:glycosyltransferase family 2 protein n=1 Tax=Nitrosophilus kaiyonis TaxID=2930200 RepID=UPI0024929042|nr:glycosyltransferase family 2 protein [Nitrosophilus kaiyonis]
MIKVSVIIVVRNEEKYIVECIRSIEKQFEDNNIWELLIVDGMSEDRTRELAENYLKNKKFRWKIVENPKKILASGWNIGIKLAIGKYVIRPDAHSKLCKNYIKEGVSSLKQLDEKVACVGGVLKNVGEGFWGEVIADLFSSKFGVGNSAFRTGVKKLEFTDTSVFGLYKRDIFDKVGLFNENLKRNQDIELHKRISNEGYKFVTNPNMKAKYFVRNNVKDLVKKAFSDGYWIIASSKSYIRHKIPLLFVSYLISIPIFLKFIDIEWFDLLYLLPLILYFILVLIFSLNDGKSYRKFLLFFLFPIFHISYGLGSLKALIDKLIMRMRKYFDNYFKVPIY